MLIVLDSALQASSTGLRGSAVSSWSPVPIALCFTGLASFYMAIAILTADDSQQTVARSLLRIIHV